MIWTASDHKRQKGDLNRKIHPITNETVATPGDNPPLQIILDSSDKDACIPLQSCKMQD
jgi:hypothetical protein